MCLTKSEKIMVETEKRLFKSIYRIIFDKRGEKRDR